MKHVVDLTNEERLGNLERELTRAQRNNRRMIIVGMGMALGALALLVVFGSPVSVARAQEEAADKTIIRAHEFVLVDEQGETRAILSTIRDTAKLILFDEKGKRRAVLSADKAASRLELFSWKGGWPRATLYVVEPWAELVLSDAQKENKAILYSSTDKASLGLYGKQKTVTLESP